MTKPTIIIQDRTWVPSASAAVETLFNAGGTASGTYKRNTGGITFYTLAGEPFAHLVANRHGERFFVSCCKHGNSMRYMFDLCSADEQRLGVAGLTYGDQNRLAASIFEQIDQAARAAKVTAAAAV